MLLVTNVIGLSFSSILTAQTSTEVTDEFSKSFVGYGENIMTPVLHGANMPFYEGEELWIMSAENARLRLTSPNGFVYTALATAEPQMLKRFGDTDVNGDWLLEQVSPIGGVLSMTIELESYATNGNAWLLFNFEEKNFSANIDRKSQSLAAFISTSGFPAVTPRGLVSINLGTEYSGPVNVKIFSTEEQVVEGYSGSTKIRVEVPSLVANFSLWALGGLVDGFLLPNIHEVGSGGMFPLRYGPIAVYLEPDETWGSAISPVRSEFYVFPFNPGSDLLLSSKIELPIEETDLKELEVVLANSTVVGFWPPVAKVHVFDEKHNRYLNSKEFSLEIGNAQIWYGDDSTHVLYMNRTFLTAPENLTATFEYELRVGGFVVGDVTPRTLTMKPPEDLTILAEACTLKVKAIDLTGQPVTATLSINNTISVPVTGEASLLLPRGLYLLQAHSTKGNETDTILLEDDMEVTFTMGLHALTVNLLMAVGVVEALVIALLAFKLRAASKAIARSLSPKHGRD